MLNELDAAGCEANNYYNDSDHIEGWFGWRVDPQAGTLTITYEQRPDEMAIVVQHATFAIRQVS
jgi:hypothetical protein